jgi:ABC-2 type transport system ATP-binding protein
VTTSTDPPAIEVEELVKVYRDGTRALDAVSLTVGPGTVCAFLGRNGAGKTTTVRVLSTLTRKTSGRALVCGVDVDAKPAEVRRLIGVALQNSALDELMTAREHLHLIAGLAGYRGKARRQRADDLLALLGLEAVGKRVIATFSGGMRRRLDLGLALVQRPRVLFLDEPTSGLDLQSRLAVWQVIEDLKADGSTIFLTTHDLGEANQLADLIAVIDQGRIRASGTPAELKEAVGRSAVTFQLAGPVDEEILKRAFKGPVEVVEGGVRIAFAGSGEDLRALLAEAHDAGLVVEQVAVAEASLEDVYVGLTGTHVDLDGAGRGAAGMQAVRQMGVSRS